MTLNELPNYINIDIKASLERFSNFEPMYLKYLKRFVSDPTYASFLEAVSANNYEEIEKTAHTIKGICGNLGLTELFNLYNEIVRATRANEIAKLNELCNEARSKTQKTVEVLQQLD